METVQHESVTSDEAIYTDNQTTEGADRRENPSPSSTRQYEAVTETHAPNNSDNPPPRPSVKGLLAPEANAVRRNWERKMYQYLRTTGNLSAEPCGPCSRTRTPCIRHPMMGKCAVCFRGHDVCEMWDETVRNNGRRRIGSKTTQKKGAEVL